MKFAASLLAFTLTLNGFSGMAAAQEAASLQAGFDALAGRQTAEAVRNFTPFAEQGTPRGLYGLGRTYLIQGGCTQDLGVDCKLKATPLIAKAAELGDPDAASLVALWHQHGSLGYPKDLSKAASWYERAGRAGLVSAWLELGHLTSRPDGGAVDAAKAIEAYEQASAGQNPYAAYRLGDIYRLGVLVPADAAKAARYYAISAERDWGPAQRRLGDAYLAGDGVARDYGQAMTWYARAQAHGEPGGAFGQAYLYYHGLGVPADPKKASLFIARTVMSSETTDQWGDNFREPKAKAFRLSATMYSAGIVLPLDPAKARRTLHAAAAYGDKEALQIVLEDAKAGDPNAEYVLGDIYHAGRELPRDSDLAFAWWRKAAEGGSLGGITRLATAYSRGWGTSREPRTAYFWLTIANRLATPVNRKSIRQARYEASLPLSRQERAQAEKAAREWKPTA